MVDDGSTDGTRTVIDNLAREHNNIKAFSHEKNRGGGAARNTAVSHTSSDIIFCLDSDDILPPDTLPKMLECLKAKKCDGVIFRETRFFELNKNKTEILANEIGPDQLVTFPDLFKNKGFLTQVNFMYKKEAYIESGGYPENHGFDTQDFGYRFLAKGHKVFVCPDTYYLHRRLQKNSSYFERVYERGDVSINMYLIYEDVIDKMPDIAIDTIMRYDIFHKNQLGKDNLGTEINELLSNDTAYKMRYDDVSNSAELTRDFRSAIKLYKNKDFSGSIDLYKDMLVTGFTSPVVFFNILRSCLAIAGIPEESIESEVKNTILSLNAKEYRKPSILKRVYRRTHLSILYGKIKSLWEK
jgi:glycosyltransferase involved in cell wall biosynthesis